MTKYPQDLVVHTFVKAIVRARAAVQRSIIEAVENELGADTAQAVLDRLGEAEEQGLV